MPLRGNILGGVTVLGRFHCPSISAATLLESYVKYWHKKKSCLFAKLVKYEAGCFTRGRKNHRIRQKGLYTS